MIHFAKKQFTRTETLACLNPRVKEWFTTAFKEPTPPQYYSIKLIHEGKNVLVTAPTGSGKTLSGFTTVISELFNMAERNELQDEVYCVYISPLKALSNDVKKNLLVPLQEVRELSGKYGIKLPEVRIAIRTGDIPAHEKQKQLKNPPHILITTPESLAILLNSPRFVEKLKNIKWVVIDEIHELASNKRGVHLSLSLERLQDLVGKEKEFVRIGLGATLYPIEEAAKFLVGMQSTGKKAEPRDCTVVDVSWFKPFDLQVKCPTPDIVHVTSDELNDRMYAMLDALIAAHKTTLIFTNTRGGTERTVFNLKRKFGYTDKEIAAHHGSLARDIRWDVEERLKKGELKVVVSSTSLELGIDIGYVELVVQIGSPKSVTRAIQRIGRSGHKLHDVARGRVIALDRDDLVETAVMLDSAIKHWLDSFTTPKNCLDVLAQHIVGMGLTRKWDVKEAFDTVRRAYPYSALGEEDFKALLKYLAGHYVDLESRRVYGKIWYEPSEGVFGRRGKFTRVIYFLNIGTIPDEVSVDVYTMDKKRVGSIEEEFLERLKKGDLFVLGGKVYKFQSSQGMRAYVERAEHEAPTIPPWFSEMLPLNHELALKIGEFRGGIASLLKQGKDKEAMEEIKKLPVDDNSAKSIYRYFEEQWAFLGEIPTNKMFLVEATRDLWRRNFLVFHCLLGRRVNDALSRVFAILVGKKLHTDIGVVVSDNGFALVMPGPIELREVHVKEVIEHAASENVYELLKKNLRRTELMKRKFRHCAARSFLVLRNYKGYRFSVGRQQLASQKLLSVCEELPGEFPIIKEAYREILEDVMDVSKASEILKKLADGGIGWKYLNTEVPSPFAHNLIVLGEADVVLMKDRRERILALHEQIMKRIEKKARWGLEIG